MNVCVDQDDFDEEAVEQQKAALDLARTSHGTVDNVMRVHSLRSSIMNGHVIPPYLHDNTVPIWFQEVISSCVSTLNECPNAYATPLGQCPPPDRRRGSCRGGVADVSTA